MKITTLIIATGALLCASAPARAQCEPELEKLFADDGTSDTRFGWEVALDDGTALVGAEWDSELAHNAGAAYVYVLDGNEWLQQAKLTADDAEAWDELGISVALEGDTAVVGAFGDDDAALNAGAVYVFARAGTSWSQVQKLTPSNPVDYGYFGFSVALDGDTLVIGAPQQGLTGSGSVSVCRRHAGNMERGDRAHSPRRGAGGLVRRQRRDRRPARGRRRSLRGRRPGSRVRLARRRRCLGGGAEARRLRRRSRRAARQLRGRRPRTGGRQRLRPRARGHGLRLRPHRRRLARAGPDHTARSAGQPSVRLVARGRRGAPRDRGDQSRLGRPEPGRGLHVHPHPRPLDVRQQARDRRRVVRRRAGLQPRVRR